MSEFFDDKFFEEFIAKKKEIKKPETSNLKRKEIYFERIENLTEPTKELLLKLKDNLEQNKYKLLIGEDASGRLPSLIFKKVIDHIYDKNGTPHAELRFIAGFRGASKESKQSKISVLKENLKPFVGSQALVISEHVASGGSMESIKNLLDEIGIKNDLATLAIQVDADYYPELGEDFYFGQDEQRYPIISGEYKMGGVNKDSDKPYAQKYPHSEEDVVKARSDVENVANNIIEWYDSLES